MKWKFAALGGAMAAAQLVGAGALNGAQAAMVVSNGATQNVSCASGVCTATAANAVLNFTTLKQMLFHGDATLVSGEQGQDIVIDATVRWASSHTLTLDSFRGIAVERPVQVTGEGGLVMTLNDGGQGGRLTFDWNGYVNFLSLSSPLTIDGQAFTLVSDIATLASAVASAPTGHYALAGNYDAHVDGTYTSAPVAVPLAGSFEGLGNKIDGLKIVATGIGSSAGLFTATLLGGSIDNVRLTHLSIHAGNHNGLVANVGGIVGLNAGTIRSSLVEGPVRGWNATLSGGIAGENTGTIDNSRTTSNVTGNIAGGIAGDNTGTIRDCMTSGQPRAITALGAPLAGGIVGENLLGTVSSSFATGNVSGVALSTIGGAAGNNTGSLNEVYALGAVAGGNLSMAGGLVGSNTGTVTQSYSTGQVTGGTLATVGGFVGTDLTLGIGISSSYWDTTTSGLGATHGAGNRLNDGGITGLTDAQLKSALPSGFSVVYWGQSGTRDSGLPFLIQLNPLPPE